MFAAGWGIAIAIVALILVVHVALEHNVRSAGAAPRVLTIARPLGFEPNRGQTIPRFKFLGRGDGYGVFIGDRETVLTVGTRRGGTTPEAHPLAVRKSPPKGRFGDVKVIEIKLVGARPEATIEPQRELPGRINYLIGNDSRHWHRGIPIYGRVLERGVWPGVDLAYYGNQRRIECDFIVAPRANPSSIRMDLVNTGKLAIDASGNLLIETGGQEMRLLKPIVYQVQGGARHEIGGRYLLTGKSRVSFRVASYDQRKTLVIDPVLTLAYSTYLGGPAASSAAGIAVDTKGSVYVTGGTGSYAGFPTKNPFQTYPGDNSAFLTKFSPDGSSLVYSTYLGGSVGGSAAGAIAVDSAGSAYVTGQTVSADFPTRNPFQPHLKGPSGNPNAFVTKFSADGSSLVYSSYLGGSGAPPFLGADAGNGIAVDSTGSAYVAGTTGSPDFPIKNAFLDHLPGGTGDITGFVTKFSSDGSSLIYSTYLGGSLFENANAIAVDSSPSAYVTGFTYSVRNLAQRICHQVQCRRKRVSIFDLFGRRSDFWRQRQWNRGDRRGQRLRHWNDRFFRLPNEECFSKYSEG